MEDKIKELEEKVAAMESFVRDLHGQIIELEGKVNLKADSSYVMQMMTDIDTKATENTTTIGATEVTVTPDSIISKVGFGFTDDQLSVIYRAVHFALLDYESVDVNGYLGDITRGILERIRDYNKKIADPFYVTNNLSEFT